MMRTKMPNTPLVMKIYSTLAAEFLAFEPEMDPNFEEPLIEHIDSNGLNRYVDEIKDEITAETRNGRFDFMAAYPFYDSLKSKVRHATPKVETQNGLVCGCLTVYLNEPLNVSERQQLLQYVQQQYQYGWGKKIAEQEIEVADGTLHLHFGADDDLNVEFEFVSVVTEENLAEVDDGAEKKKYEITDIAHPDNPKLHRIRSLVDLCDDVLKGTLGGYVESYENLSQEGDSWVGKDAVACEDAYVSGNAILTDCAVAKGSSYIGKNALVAGNAVVQDYAIIAAGWITETACVCGYAKIWSEEQQLCTPTIRGNARVYGDISGNVICRGAALILPGTSLINRTGDCFIFEDDRVSVELAERTPPPKEPRTHDFER